MNGYQRYRMMIEGRRVDFLPRIPIVMQFAAEYIGSNYGAFASDHRILVEANFRCARDFGFDQLSAISDPYRETQGFGGKVTYVPDGVPLCTHPLDTLKDISLLDKPDPHKSVRMSDRLRAIEEYRRSSNGEYSIMGWIEGPAAEAADLRGVVNFLTDTIEDPDYLALLMDMCVETGIDFAKSQIEAGADTIGIGDAVASQLSPETYASLVLPRERILVDAIHDAGGLVRLHICGNTTHLLAGIATLGVDVLDVDHMVDLKMVREIVGSTTVISCNINPVAGVLGGTPLSIRDYVKHAYSIAGGPFMVAAGCEIPAKTPLENLRALCEPIEQKGVQLTT